MKGKHYVTLGNQSVSCFANKGSINTKLYTYYLLYCFNYYKCNMDKFCFV